MGLVLNASLPELRRRSDDLLRFDGSAYEVPVRLVECRDLVLHVVLGEGVRHRDVDQALLVVRVAHSDSILVLLDQRVHVLLLAVVNEHGALHVDLHCLQIVAVEPRRHLHWSDQAQVVHVDLSMGRRPL